MNDTTPGAPAAKVRVLCVDDEPAVLESLKLNLRRRFEVLTAPNGPAALQLLGKEPDVAIVVSDMRMPGMDGAEFLSQVRKSHPACVRVLLTGQAEMESAVAAVNHGQIFRFLTKPCPPEELIATLCAAAEQHRLACAERVLLEQTLRGSIKTLVDVLALTSPSAFGRAARLKQLAGELAEELQLPERWSLEVAAMLSQLGAITLPPQVLERWNGGEALDEQERKMVVRASEVTEQLLGNIPRLELVLGILAGARGARPHQSGVFDPQGVKTMELGAQILKLVLDYDALEMQGQRGSDAVSVIRSRGARYDARVAQALERCRGTHQPRDEIREVSLSGVRVGMVFAEDVRLASGILLVARGYEVTVGFLERLRNFKGEGVREPLRVVLRAARAAAA